MPYTITLNGQTIIVDDSGPVPLFTDLAPGSSQVARDTVQRLAGTSRRRRSGGALAAAADPQAIPAVRKAVSRDNNSPQNAGDGIASPLTEKTTGSPPLADRAYHADAPVTLTSADGLFVAVFQPIKTLRLRDANGYDVQLDLAKVE